MSSELHCRIRVTLLLVLCAVVSAAEAQPPTPAPSGEFRPPTPSPSYRLDTSRDNLVHAPGYLTAPLGSLGEIVVRGEGETPVILLAGLGMGWRVFENLIAATEREHRFVGITLPGYGGSSAPPMPSRETPYSDRTWLSASRNAIRDCIRSEKLERPLIVAAFSEAAHIALELAVEAPEQIGGVLVLTASPRFPLPPGTGDRGTAMQGLADQWFRNVSAIMWPSGMFPPECWSRDRARAEKAWWEALDPTIPTSVRYYLETWSVDLVPKLAKLETPVTVLSPGFDDEGFGAANAGQLRARFHDGWNDTVEAGSRLEHRVIEGARFLIWEDEPRAVRGALRELREKRATALQTK